MKRKGVFLIALAGILLLIIGGTHISYQTKLNNQLEQNIETRFFDTVRPTINSFELQINEQIKKVKMLARFLGEQGELGDQMQQELLKIAVEENGLLRCAIAFPDGSFITHDNQNEGNVAQDAFFQASMNGEFFISDPRPAVVDVTKSVILFACPIERDNVVVASLIFSYLGDDLDGMFDLKLLEGRGQILVIKENGMPLIGNIDNVSKPENILTSLREQCSHKEHRSEQCASLDGEEGTVSVSMKDTGEIFYLHYDKLKKNDWYMLSIASEETITHTIVTAAKEQRVFSTVLWLCILLYTVIVVIFFILEHYNSDKMTGLLSLESFKRKARKILYQNRGQREFVVIKLDVKDFKLINRIYDFQVGDRVIVSMAAALSEITVDLDALCARVGADNFLLLLPYDGKTWLTARREAFIASFKTRMGRDFTTMIEFPTGQYLVTKQDYPRPDINDILEKVNFAHRAAKQNYDIIIDYVEDIEKEALLARKIEDRMKQAFHSSEFNLYLQPKYRVSDETMCGAEALVRWKVDDRYFMHPTDFIPVLERNGFIIRLDMYMFECAAKKLRQMIEEGENNFPISVNFSRHHLKNENFAQQLCVIADRYNVPHHLLEIELTESVIIENTERMMQLIEELHACGFEIAMDDFGTGASSLSQLSALKVDTIKLDKSFFDEKLDPERAQIVVGGILEIAKKLGLKTVAEGIEKTSQVTMLRDLECDIIQGFIFSRPIPETEIEKLRRQEVPKQE